MAACIYGTAEAQALVPRARLGALPLSDSMVRLMLGALRDFSDSGFVQGGRDGDEKTCSGECFNAADDSKVQAESCLGVDLSHAIM